MMRTRLLKIILLILLATLLLLTPVLASSGVVVDTEGSVEWNTDSVGYNAFYASGKYWIFYKIGSSNPCPIVYKTSPDGITWSDRTTLCYSYHYNYTDFSLFYDDTRNQFHYARWQAYNTPVYYRKGIPQADGTIDWYTVEQIATGDLSPSYGLSGLSVAVDSDGFPFVAYAYDGDAYVTKSRRNDGVWETDDTAGFPFKMEGKIDQNEQDIALLSMTNRQIYALLYCASFPLQDKYLEGRVWNGNAWTDVDQAEYITSDDCGFWWAATNLGDRVYVGRRRGRLLVRQDNNTYESYEIPGYAGSDYTCPMPVVWNTAGDIVVYWLYTNHVFYEYFNFSSETWGGKVDWYDEELDPIPDDKDLTVTSKVYNGDVAMFYRTTSALKIGKPVPPPVVDTLVPSNYVGTSVTLRGEIVATAVNCDHRGFVWGTSSGDYIYNWDEPGEFEAGYFERTTNIYSSVRYYYRARAYSPGGWGYGDEVSFPGTPADYPSGDMYGIPAVTDYPDMFHETGEEGPGYPGETLPLAPFIYEQLNAVGIPMVIFWVLLALGLSIAIGIITFNATEGNILATAVAPGIVWGLFAVIGGGLVPFWTVIIYAVIAATVVISTKVFSL